MQSANGIGGGGGGSYTAGSGTGSRTRDLGLRAQKKLLGRIVSTGAGRSLFIDDATASLLDNLYKLMESVAKSNPHLDKKEPEKVLKNIVKLSIKVIRASKWLSAEKYRILNKFKLQFNSISHFNDRILLSRKRILCRLMAQQGIGKSS